jgi:hypothetical protein
MSLEANGDSKGVDVRFIHGSLFCGILTHGRLYSQESSECDGHAILYNPPRSENFLIGVRMVLTAQLIPPHSISIWLTSYNPNACRVPQSKPVQTCVQNLTASGSPERSLVSRSTEISTNNI